MATPLPTTAALTTPPSSHAAMRTNLANLRAFLAGLLGDDGTGATARATLGTLLAAQTTCSAATAVQASDRGRLFNCTGTWSLTLPGVATLPTGWCIVVNNNGTGTITLTPPTPNLIDGGATYKVYNSRAVIVMCTGIDYLVMPLYPGKMSGKRILGNDGSNSAAPASLTPAQVAAMLPLFGETLAGLVPATGGVSGAFLRSDGVWVNDDLVTLAATQTIGGIKRFDGAGAWVLLGRPTDPEAPEPGQIWHDAATGHIKAFIADGTSVLDGQAAIPMLVPPAGQYAMTTVGVGGGALGSAAGAAGLLDLYPYTPRADVPVVALAVNCTTAVAGAQGKFVLYAADQLGRPDALLIESATVDLSSTGVKTAALAGVRLRAGRTYWLGFRHSSTASISTWPITATPDINGGAPSTAARKILRRSISFSTAAPSTWGFNAAEINAAAAPAIWIKL